MLGKRRFPLECAAAKVCREAGARVATNVWVRDMDLGEQRFRRVLWRGAQLAIDTTLVSPFSRDGSASRRAANHDGAALQRAKRRKEATHPELSGEGGRARLVVLAAEVGGRWSVETAQFLSALVKAKAQSAPHLLQGRVEAAWLHRWSATLGCSAVSAGLAPVPGTGDAIPSTHEVMRDNRFS